MNAINNTAPYFFSVGVGPDGDSSNRSSTFPLLAVLAGMALLVARAPITDVVPATEIAPMNASQTDLTLNEVVARFEAYSPGRKAEATRLGKLVMELSKHYQLSPSLILAVIESESSFRPSVVSKAGAIGLMQLLPDTASFVAEQFHITSYHGEADLYDPAVNLRLGVAYLSYLRHQFGHSLHFLAAYNLGPSALRKRLNDGDYDLGALDHYVRLIHERARSMRASHYRGVQQPAVAHESALTV